MPINAVRELGGAGAGSIRLPLLMRQLWPIFLTVRQPGEAANCSVSTLRPKASLQSARCDLVVSAIAVDERNHALDAALRRSGIPELSRWRDVFKGRARFAVFTRQEWVRWVQEHDTESRWSDWLGHVRSRYDLGGQRTVGSLAVMQRRSGRDRPIAAPKHLMREVQNSQVVADSAMIPQGTLLDTG